MATARVQVEAYAAEYIGWGKLRRAVAAALDLPESEITDEGAVRLSVRAFRGDVLQRIVLDVDASRVPTWTDPEALVPALANALGVSLFERELDAGWSIVGVDGARTSRESRHPTNDAAIEPHSGDSAEAWLEHHGYRHLERIGQGSPSALFRATSESGPVLVTVATRIEGSLADFARRMAYESPRTLPVVDLRVLRDGGTLLAEKLPDAESMARTTWHDVDVRRVGAALAADLAVLHTGGRTVGELWPELVFARGPQGGAQLVGYSPRHQRLMRSLAPVSVGVLWPLRPTSTAPEITHGMPDSAAIDVFALGVLLFRLATDALPFEGDTMQAQMMAVLKNRRSAVRVPGALGALLDRALRIEPTERISLADFERELLRDLPSA